MFRSAARTVRRAGKGSNALSTSHVLSCILALALVIQFFSVWATMSARLRHRPEAPARKRVAYAVSVTKDGSYMDGAAVLA